MVGACLSHINLFKDFKKIIQIVVVTKLHKQRPKIKVYP
jgi:hypothetical protein